MLWGSESRKLDMVEVRKIENVAVGAGSKPRRDLGLLRSRCITQSAWCLQLVRYFCCRRDTISDLHEASPSLSRSREPMQTDQAAKMPPSWLTKCGGQ